MKFFLRYNLTVHFINPEVKSKYYSSLDKDDVNWSDNYLIVVVGEKVYRHPWSAISEIEQEGLD